MSSKYYIISATDFDASMADASSQGLRWRGDRQEVVLEFKGDAPGALSGHAPMDATAARQATSGEAWNPLKENGKR